MSACLSVTVITSVDTRLNAATATISVRMMNIIVFSICTASYQAALVRVQSCTRTLRAQAHGQAVGGRAGVVHVGQAQLHAGGAAGAVQLGGVVQRGQRQRAVVLVVADREHAHHVERLQARQRARGRHLRARARSPSPGRRRLTPSERASSAPSTMFQLPGVSLCQHALVLQAGRQVGDLRPPRPDRRRAPPRRACRRRARAATASRCRAPRRGLPAPSPAPSARAPAQSASALPLSSISCTCGDRLEHAVASPPSGSRSSPTAR